MNIDELSVAIYVIARDIDEGDGAIGIKGARALNSTKHSELLEARDRKRDAQLLRVIAEKHFAPGHGHYEQLELLAEHRESGEWIPELGD